MRRTVLLLAAVAVLAGCTGLAKVEPSRYPDPKRDSITFWGHACSYIDVGGMGIVTDPVFDKNLWQRRRFIGSPPPESLRNVQVVLISHAHNDHLSPSSLERFPKGVQILCPVPSAGYLKNRGLNVKTMKPGDEMKVGDIRIVAVAAHHPGTRLSVHAVSDGRALGWVIVTPSATIYYSGDTDFCSTFAEVGGTYAPDIALLNVNGHLPPVDAARAAAALRVPVVIPTHWGAYAYWLRGGGRRPRGEDELRRLLGKRLHVLNVGESLPLARPAAKP